MPTLHIHIGESKTGTTSVQTTLQMSREVLAEAGFWYPVAAGFRRQADLFTAMEPKVGTPKHKERNLGTKAEWRAYSDKLIADFDKEREAFPDADCVVSSEHFPSLSPEGLAKMKAFAEARFDRVKVYFYFRNPVDWEISIYSTRIKSGDTTRFSDQTLFAGGFRQRSNRHQRLRNWEQTFGPDNVDVVFFSRSSLRNQSVVDDLLGRIGIDPGIMVMPKEDKNEALNLVSLEVLRRLNDGVFDGIGYTKKQRWPFVRSIGRVTRGDSLAVRPETAARIKAAYEKAVSYYSSRSGVPVERIMETKRIRADGPTLETFELSMEDTLWVIGEIKKSSVDKRAGAATKTTAAPGDGGAKDQGDTGKDA